MNEDVRVFEDSETLKVGLEKTRKQILELLRVKDMSISQIAEALDKDQSTIYRHVKKLEEAGFIEVKGERREHHIPERIYGRTADMFLMSPEPIEQDAPERSFIGWEEKKIERCLDCLKEAGFEFKGEKDEVVEELADILKELNEEVNEKFSTSTDIDKNKNFFFMLQLKFLAALIKLENEDELKEKIKVVASRFET